MSQLDRAHPVWKVLDASPSPWFSMRTLSMFTGISFWDLCQLFKSRKRVYVRTNLGGHPHVKLRHRT